MKAVLALLFVCLATRFCLAQDKRIKEVENGLLPLTQVSGKPYVHYNVSQRLVFYNIPSVSIAVINHGRLAFAKAYGWADSAKRQPATAQTIYQAASLSKTANAVLVMQLTKKGHLSLDTDIRHYLKSWIFPETDSSKGKKITLTNLLSHTAGINVPGFMGYSKDGPVPNLNQILDGALPANNEAVKPIYPPGKAVQYSGGGTVIIQKIIEDQTGQHYANIITHQILVPLGMRHSSYAMPLPQSMETSAATGYDANEKPIAGKYKIYPELAPAGLWTTPTDFTKLLIDIQQRYKHSRMTSLVLDNSALGGFVYQMGNAMYFAHNGHNAGYNAVFYYDMIKGNGVVIMVNSDNNTIMPEILKSVAAAYHWGGVYKPRIISAVSVPDSLLKTYTGIYYCSKLKRTIQIKNRGAGLEMFQELECKKGKDCFEQLYFSNGNTGFVLSSGLVWVFSDNGQKLMIHDGDDVYEAVKKQ